MTENTVTAHGEYSLGLTRAQMAKVLAEAADNPWQHPILISVSPSADGGMNVDTFTTIGAARAENLASLLGNVGRHMLADVEGRA